MANLTAALNDHVQRLAGRVAQRRTKPMRKQVSAHRRDLAALKRQVAALQKAVSQLQRADRKRGDQPAAAAGAGSEGGRKPRFIAKGLRTHRAKLGISAADYGRLVGASGLSVYHWEAGKTTPRPAQIEKLAAVRSLGKREAARRLEELDAQGSKSKKK